MGLLDLFKFTPPGDKKYGLFLSNYIKEEQHILECFGDIAASGSVDGLKLDFDLSKRDEVEANKKLLKQFDGQFVYDPFEGNYKRIEFIDGQPYFDEFDSIESIVLKTNKADTEEPEKDSSVPDFGMSIEDPIP